jgi:hypothetical protein
MNATRPKYSPNCGRELKGDNSAVLVKGACDFTWATSCAACDWSGMSTDWRGSTPASSRAWSRGDPSPRRASHDACRGLRHPGLEDTAEHGEGGGSLYYGQDRQAKAPHQDRAAPRTCEGTEGTVEASRRAKRTEGTRTTGEATSPMSKELLAPDYVNRLACVRVWRVAPTLWAQLGGLLWGPGYQGQVR